MHSRGSFVADKSPQLCLKCAIKGREEHSCCPRTRQPEPLAWQAREQEHLFQPVDLEVTATSVTEIATDKTIQTPILGDTKSMVDSAHSQPDHLLAEINCLRTKCTHSADTLSHVLTDSEHTGYRRGFQQNNRQLTCIMKMLETKPISAPPPIWFTLTLAGNALKLASTPPGEPPPPTPPQYMRTDTVTDDQLTETGTIDASQCAAGIMFQSGGVGPGVTAAAGFRGRVDEAREGRSG